MPSFKQTPWFTCYAQPLSTFRRILEDTPLAYSIMMAIASGYAMVLQHLFNRGLADHNIPGAIYLEAFVIGPIFGLICYLLSGYFLRLIALRFGGSGTAQANRDVWVWSFIPYLSGAVLLWVPLTVAAVLRAVLWYSLPEWARHALLWVEIAFYYAFIPFWAWSLYLFISGLTVANKFSWRQALLTTLFAYFILGLVLWLLMLGIHMLGYLA